MGEYSERIKNMRWSYSRLSLYDSGCPYAWYLQYLYTDSRGRPLTDQVENVWSAYGSFMHGILERLFKKEIGPMDALNYFVDNFDDALADFDNEELKGKKFDAGLLYLQKMVGRYDDLMNNMEILEVEGKHDFEYLGRQFTGRIDLLYIDKKENALVIADHKSAASVIGKRGQILKSEKNKLDGYIKQMCLYSYPVIQEYGKPKYLEWNFFNSCSVYRMPFDEKKYHEALDWAIKTIETIEQDEDFLANRQFFFCNKLCDFREDCDEKFED